MLAADQRGNLRRALHPNDPDSTTAHEMSEFKVELMRSLSGDASAVLLDPEYGAAQAISAGALSSSAGLIVALEATGYAESPHDRRSEILPGWSPAKAEALGASAAKLLVYFHPDAPGAQGQIDLITDTATRCAEVDLPLIVEPLSFSLTDESLSSEEKRRVVVETARILGSIEGVDLLKMEFPATPDDEEGWEGACTELDAASPLPWVILSAGVDFDTFVQQARVACGAGASGVLAGRAVWKESVGMPIGERQGFYATTGTDRLASLTEVVESYAKPWRESSNADIPQDWYA
jgi:tagatose 1,6-diphosphate aldolase